MSSWGPPAVRRPYQDAPVRRHTLGLARHARHGVDDVVHALALERGHRLQANRLAVLLDLLDGVLGDRGEFLAAVRPVAADVEQQTARRAGLPEDGEAGQLLERLQGGAALTDQILQPLTDHLDHRTAGGDQLVDVAVVVEDVEQALDVVGGDLALSEQVAVGSDALGRLGLLGRGC